jgi:hypothetical protein
MKKGNKKKEVSFSLIIKIKSAIAGGGGEEGGAFRFRSLPISWAPLAPLSPSAARVLHLDVFDA